MAYSSLLLEVDERGIALVTINRPDKLNALNRAVIDDLEDCFQDLDSDDDIRCVILTGAGHKAFAAGADIQMFRDMGEEDAVSFARRGQNVFNIIEQCTMPVIAAVNGFALGGGCELALACHIRIASENAQFGQPEINLGILPGFGGTQRLPRIVGPGIAAEMILTGERVSASRAFEIGLVNRVSSPDALIKDARAVAAVIAEKAPLAIAYAIEAFRAADEINFEEGLEREVQLFGRAFGTQDAVEGVSAFLEKRKPKFTGA